GGNPVRHRSPLGAVGDGVGHQPPPVALLADAPAAQPSLDDLVQLQTVRLIATGTVWLAREEDREVDQHRDRRTHHPKWAADGLAVVFGRRHPAPFSFYTSNGKE